MAQLSTPADLEGYMLERLIHVVGSPLALASLAAAKKLAEIDQIACVRDFIVVSKVLAKQDGYIGIVGDLIALEAERWGTP